jgi:hypothetical protein
LPTTPRRPSATRNSRAKFPGEKQAFTALGNAYSFRIGLGEFDKAIEDMNSFVKYYGDKKPADAANVVFQMSEVYEKQSKTDELAKHLDAYLKKWGAKGASTSRSSRTSSWARLLGRSPARRKA